MRIQHLQYFFAVLLCLFTIQLDAQESFERVYSAGQDAVLGRDIQQTSDGGYLTTSIVLNTDAENQYYSNITKFSPKGDVDWAKNYQLDTQQIVSQQIILLVNDTFALLSRKETLQQQQILSKFTPNGDLVWSKAYMGDTPDAGFGSRSSLLSIEETEGFGIFNTLFRDTQTDLVISFLDSLGNIEQGTIYNTDEDNTIFVDAERTVEKGYIALGLHNTSNFLFKIDPLRNERWSKLYSSASLIESIQFSSLISTPDTSFLVVGSTSSLDRNAGFVLKVDSLGIPLWGKIIQLNTPILNFTTFGNIVMADDGDFIISGTDSPTLGADLTLVMLKISPAGDIRWVKKYSEIEPSFRHSLTQTNDGGAVFFSSKTPEASDDLAFPYLAKINADGVSSCEDTISFIMDTLIVQVDTLIFEKEDFNNMEEVTPTVSTFNDYQVPILSLEIPPPFCEGEPIMWTFDASTPGAVSYDWSTGETTDSITVMEEGMYTVDVRIETDVCFNLCDTATISTMGPPMAEIRNIGDYCLDNFTTLAALPAGDSFLWSTGETTQSIEVTELGSYSVTITNRCGEGTATFEVVQEAPTVEIVVVQDSICADGEAILTFNSPNASSFEWSNGSVVETITVTAEDVYSITVTNGCGTGENSVELSCEPPVCTPKAPNLFTPNNDSANDTFGVLVQDGCADIITVRLLRIYNRWGQLVFETTTGQDWDGRYENDLAPSDVYIYYAEIENTSMEENGGIEILKGDVTLVR